jgi:hypothetical protein
MTQTFEDLQPRGFDGLTFIFKNIFYKNSKLTADMNRTLNVFVILSHTVSKD